MYLPCLSARELREPFCFTLGILLVCYIILCPFSVPEIIELYQLYILLETNAKYLTVLIEIITTA
jgi:predicted membrane metal-binding protein